MSHVRVSEIVCSQNFSCRSTTGNTPSVCGAIRGFHRIQFVKHTATVLALAVALSAHAQTKTFTIDGFFTARGVNTGDRPSWLERGPNRFDARGTDGFAIAQLGADWNPNEHFDAHVSGPARREPSSFGGRRAGIVQAYVDANAGGFQRHAGSLYPPTARANK